MITLSLSKGEFAEGYILSLSKDNKLTMIALRTLL